MKRTILIAALILAAAVPALAEPMRPSLKPPPTIAFRMGSDLDHSYNVLRGSFTLTNQHDVDVADVRVRCDVIAQSDTVIDTYKFTVFRKIAAGKSTTMRGYRFGYWPQQGERVKCSTEGARVIRN